MQIYVWNDFCCDYSAGLAVVIADSPEAAIKILEIALDGEYFFEDWGNYQVEEIAEGFCQYVTGGA